MDGYSIMLAASVTEISGWTKCKVVWLHMRVYNIYSFRGLISKLFSFWKFKKVDVSVLVFLTL